ncbi:hypothetical protein DFR42_12420 [Undibacterium pigrum]|uniref:Uncharacterized protein n=1 Tax=Undibacterium pigrum TaxID=401470 RepID=A0A318ILV3_9BURK|nr:hypothetical protein DFR42_12420 [Undibacterium pigrum]
MNVRPDPMPTLKYGASENASATMHNVPTCRVQLLRYKTKKIVGFPFPLKATGQKNSK